MLSRTTTLIFCSLALLLGANGGCDPKSEPVVPNQPTEHSADSKSAANETPASVSVTDSVDADESGSDQAVSPDENTGEATAAIQPSLETDRPANVNDSLSERKFEADGEIRVLAWNIESDGANPDVIGRQLKAMPRYDIYGLTEVRPNGFPAIKAALGNEYTFMYSKSGFDDRLAFAIRKDRFEIIDWYEFNTFKSHVINPGNYRAPFVFELRDKITGRQFEIVINHLARGKAEIRQEQALAIRMWAEAEKKPIIAIGDYNFDYVFDTDKGNPSMDVFLEGGIFKWIRPVPMVDSNYFDGDKDGKDDFIDSLLDFVFAAGDAQNWNMDCQVVVREGDFPDDDQTSDHRPIQLIIKP